MGNDGVGLWDAKGKFVGRYECFQTSVVRVLYRVQEGYVILIYISLSSLWFWLVIGQDKE